MTTFGSFALRAEPLEAERQVVRRVVWMSRRFAFGTLSSAVEGPGDALDEAYWPWPTLEVPRAFVRFHPEGGRPFVADPTAAVLQDPERPFRREVLSGGETLCDWLAVDPGLLFEVRPEVKDWWPRFFPASQAPLPAPAFLLLHHAAWYAEEKDASRSLMDEALLRIVDLVVGDAAPGAAHLVRRPTPAELDLVEKTKALLSADPGGKHTMESIALELGYSKFYLWRTFRRATGQTLHEYLTQLRLRGVWEEVVDPESDLAGIALDRGYSSHSHFTATFRQVFGVTPSELRRNAASISGQTLRRLLATSYGAAGD